MKQGYLTGLSVGYRTEIAASGPVKGDRSGQQVRHLKQIQLFEVSPVTFPANDLAQVEEVKSRHHRHAVLLAELELRMTMADIAAEAEQMERERKAQEQAAFDADIARLDALFKSLR